jgi:dTDP-4-dehydrorhamnose reductase
VILVTGANGQLGLTLKEIDNSLHFKSREDFDIQDEIYCRNYLEKNQIKVILNLAAYTAVDKAEDETEKASLINSIAVRSLAQIAKDLDIYLIHVSTDYVFNGNSSRPYDESDLTAPQSIYGKTKLNGENAIEETLNNFSIVRTSWLYSPYSINFLKTMLRLGKEKNEISVVCDQIGTPTSTYDLALVLLELCKRKIPGKNIYHYSNEGVASWYDFAVAIMKEANLACKVKPILTKDYPTKAQRPAFSVLSKEKIKSELNILIPHWQESLKVCLKKIS